MSDWYMRSLESDIRRLQEKVERARKGRGRKNREVLSQAAGYLGLAAIQFKLPKGKV